MLTCFDLACYLARLTDLDVRVPAGCNVDGLLSVIPQLCTLSVWFMHGCKQSDVIRLGAAVGKLPSLTSLRFTGASRIDGHLGTWNLPELTDLDLSAGSVEIIAPKLATACTSAGISQVSGLQSCPLTKLDTTADGSLFSALEQGACPKLQHLKVRARYADRNLLLAALDKYRRPLTEVCCVQEGNTNPQQLQSFLHAHPGLEWLSWTTIVWDNPLPHVSSLTFAGSRSSALATVSFARCRFLS